MEENIQVQDELSLSEIFKILLRKIKTLVVILLCGVIAGAGFAVFKTANVHYYGTTVSFYINPRLDKSSSTEVESQYGIYGAYGMNVMNNMVLLLSSELFAEQLLLENDGLPSEALVTSLGSDELASKVQTAKTEKALAQEKVELVNDAINDLSEKNTAVSALNTEVNTLWAAYRNAHPNENLNSTPTKIDGETVLNGAIDALANAKTEVETATATLNVAEEAANNQIEKAEEATNDALELWRETDENYEKKITLVLESLSYSYMEKNMETENTNNLARSFIYVDISVLNNQDFANTLLERIREAIPAFVEENMPIPSGYTGTNCQRITRLDKIDLTNSGYMLKSMLKYGLLLGAAALIIACVLVIVADRSNKRLTDYEQTMERFKVPVLGVIPAIRNKDAEKKTEEVEA